MHSLICLPCVLHSATSASIWFFLLLNKFIQKSKHNQRNLAYLNYKFLTFINDRISKQFTEYFIDPRIVYVWSIVLAYKWLFKKYKPGSWWYEKVLILYMRCLARTSGVHASLLLYVCWFVELFAARLLIVFTILNICHLHADA